MSHLSLTTDEGLNAALAKFNSMLYRVAFTRMQNRADAEDIVQEVWLRYLRSAPAFVDDEHRKAWLLKVCINCSNSLLSSSWFKRTSALDESMPDDAQDPAEGFSDVYAAVQKLPPKYRTVIHLFYYEDLSVKQIAEVTGQGESSVKTQLHRARTMLRERLGGEYDDL